MNATREPSEPMGGDLEYIEHWEPAFQKHVYSTVVINQFNSKCYNLIRNQIFQELLDLSIESILGTTNSPGIQIGYISLYPCIHYFLDDSQPFLYGCNKIEA